MEKQMVNRLLHQVLMLVVALGAGVSCKSTPKTTMLIKVFSALPVDTVQVNLRDYTDTAYKTSDYAIKQGRDLSTDPVTVLVEVENNSAAMQPPGDGTYKPGEIWVLFKAFKLGSPAPMPPAPPTTLPLSSTSKSSPSSLSIAAFRSKTRTRMAFRCVPACKHLTVTATTIPPWIPTPQTAIPSRPTIAVART